MSVGPASAGRPAKAGPHTRHSRDELLFPALRRMAHFLVGDAKSRQRPLGEISDRHHALDRKKAQERFEKRRTDEQLARCWDAIRGRIALCERMKRKRIPEQ